MLLPARSEAKARVATAATLFAVALVSAGAPILGLGPAIESVIGVAAAIGTVYVFYRLPHLIVAMIVGLFPLIPAMKVFISPNIGAAKDLIDITVIVAAAAQAVFSRRLGLSRVSQAALLLLAVYILNPLHAHGSAWAQGVRLTGEPLLLLLVGLSIPSPQRALRIGAASLAGIGGVAALYGLLQQLLGPSTLVTLGYSYGLQVRTVGPLLRSFGTLDDPFSYSALLLLALAVCVFYWRPSGLRSALISLLLLGLVASFVRTALLIGLAFVALELMRQRLGFLAVMLTLAAVVIASVTLLRVSGEATSEYAIYVQGSPVEYVTEPIPGALALNGRVSAWSAAVGSNPANWLVGRGVGDIGTAAQRATSGAAASVTTTSASGGPSQLTATNAVDSGYFSTLADVGVIGVGILISLWTLLVKEASAGARLGSRAGWLALAIVSVVLLDALSRAVFTEFPTMYIAYVVLGLCIGTVRQELH